MVLAGPGSGKTSVIVERTAYMTGEGQIPPENILVVTFSRAAAKEMKERFLKFTGQSATRVTFGTFLECFMESSGRHTDLLQPIFCPKKKSPAF